MNKYISSHMHYTLKSSSNILKLSFPPRSFWQYLCNSFNYTLHDPITIDLTYIDNLSKSLLKGSSQNDQNTRCGLTLAICFDVQITIFPWTQPKEASSSLKATSHLVTSFWKLQNPLMGTVKTPSHVYNWNY